MASQRVSSYITTRAFWRGVASGLTSPAGRRGFMAGLRVSVYAVVVGAFALLRWVQHARRDAGRPPLTSLAELGVSMIGAMTAVLLMLVAERVFRRGNR